MKQTAGEQSTNIQSGRDTNITLITSMDHIVASLKQSLFPELSDLAKKTAEECATNYLIEISGSLEKDGANLQDFSQTIDTTDFQYTARNSIITAVKLDSDEQRKTLAQLLVHRLKSPEDLKRVALNESIDSLGKLTPDHLKIVSLIFLLTAIRFQDVLSWESLKNHLETRVSKFMDFKSNSSQFEYLNYTGHALVSPFSWSFMQNLVGIYTHLFYKKINQERLSVLKNPEKIKPIIEGAGDDGENKFFKFKVINKEALTEYLKDYGIENNSEEHNQILSIYQEGVLSVEEAKALFIQETGGENGIGSKLCKLVEETSVQRTSLTLVGKVTAMSNIEIQCDTKINYDEWVNS